MMTRLREAFYRQWNQELELFCPMLPSDTGILQPTSSRREVIRGAGLAAIVAGGVGRGRGQTVPLDP